ncbi:MAG: hypothetical protein GX349_00950 [Firmicutes bacterium]|nr:hypothetical protein [Bacillota bacterium]
MKAIVLGCGGNMGLSTMAYLKEQNVINDILLTEIDKKSLMKLWNGLMMIGFRG